MDASGTVWLFAAVSSVVSYTFSSEPPMPVPMLYTSSFHRRRGPPSASRVCDQENSTGPAIHGSGETASSEATGTATYIKSTYNSTCDIVGEPASPYAFTHSPSTRVC